MANVIISPNMNLPVPTVSEDPGPDWSTNINGCMSAIDSHNHTSGQGVQISPAGMDINADLSMGQNNLTTVRSVNFTAQGAPIALAGDLGCIYVSGSDLYYNDEAGNQVRITQSGSVTGSTGTITGLPSGTASASYSAGTFTFQGATSTPATMAVGPVVIGRAVASSKTVTLTPNSGQAADFGLTFPAALPASTQPVFLDTSGNLSNVAVTGSGSVVLATAPTFAGVPAGTITAASFSPTITFTKTSGNTLTFTVNTSTWYYQRIGNTVFVNGYIKVTVSGWVAASSGYGISATIPVSTASLTPAGSAFISTASSSALAQSIGASGTTDVTLFSSAGSLTGITYSANGAGGGTWSYSYLVS